MLSQRVRVSCFLWPHSTPLCKCITASLSTHLLMGTWAVSRLKKFSASLTIREIQIKTTMWYHLTCIILAIINNQQVLARMWRKGNPSAQLVGLQTGAATVENSMEFPQKIKNRAAYDLAIPVLGIWLRRPKALIWKNICTPMFIAVLFTIAKCWKQP